MPLWIFGLQAQGSCAPSVTLCDAERTDDHPRV